MELVTPFIKAGGADTVYVMPNLTPPLTSVADVLDYHRQLTSLASDVTFLMTLFLHSSLTPEIIREAAGTGVIHGVKLYPAGVTTNSMDGILDIEEFYPVFRAMEDCGLVLNLHGEMTSSSSEITTMNAERLFMPSLLGLHREFPQLRIVLEHVSTREGLDAVRQCGTTVAGTITAHHPLITHDDATSDVFSFCKPVAKTLEDRKALVQTIVSGSPKFFFGSDSAPHPIQQKEAPNHAAGCFTQPYICGYLISALEEGLDQGWISPSDITLEKLEGFLSRNGKAFYGLTEGTKRKLTLSREGEKIPEFVGNGTLRVKPFRSGTKIWSSKWKD